MWTRTSDTFPRLPTTEFSGTRVESQSSCNHVEPSDVAALLFLVAPQRHPRTSTAIDVLCIQMLGPTILRHTCPRPTRAAETFLMPLTHALSLSTLAIAMLEPWRGTLRSKFAHEMDLFVRTITTGVPTRELDHEHVVWKHHRHLSLHGGDHLHIRGLVLHELFGLLDGRQSEESSRRWHPSSC